MIFKITNRLELQNDLVRIEFEGGAFLLVASPPAIWKVGTKLKLDTASPVDLALQDLKKNPPSNTLGAVQSPWRPPELSDADVQAALDLT